MRWMVEARQSGGMVRYIGMGELNALPFFASWALSITQERVKIVKTVEYTWPPKARTPSLNPPIPCPFSYKNRATVINCSSLLFSCELAKRIKRQSLRRTS